MRLVGNIIWFLFGGLILAILWLVLGLLLCITIVGIPFGVQCFKVAGLVVAPFGKCVETRFDKHPVANLLWAILFGWELAIGFLVAGILNCITIVGIPLGLQSFKFMKLAFLPFGATVKKNRKN